MKIFLGLLLLIGTSLSLVSLKLDELPTTYSMKFLYYEEKGELRMCEILNEGVSQPHRSISKKQDVVIERFPSVLEHLKEPTSAEMVEIFGQDKEKVQLKFRELCHSFFHTAKDTKNNTLDEVHVLSKSGSSDNRVDIVFMGDGYTRAQKQKFLDDMKRLHSDMFGDVTFANYLPLFNAWAVYRESTESGIGTHSRPRNTAYRLYRVGTELRGVYCGNQAAARASCQATGRFACDYPTLIGNDPYYGGLGGEFAISTSSETSGTIVLRHEFGHNFGKIGEEYDSGGYFGANHASSLAVARTKWKDWFTGAVAEQKSQIRINAYPWYDLAKGPLSLRFTSTGTFKRWSLKFTVSGVETQDSLEVTLDGVKLDWKTTGLLDRGFHDFYSRTGLARGEHVVVFSQKTPPRTPNIRQVCNVGFIEYQNDDEYNFDNDNVNAYPVWTGTNVNGYRSQNEYCLMRNMTSPHFCKVCKENLWLQFFRRVNCIDSVNVVNLGDGNVKVTANMVKIAQFREGRSVDGELFTFDWTRNGVVQNDLKDKFEWIRKESDAKGSWGLSAKFISKEIRMDPTNLSVFKRTFSIN